MLCQPVSKASMQQHVLAGAMVWELGEDSSDAQLLKAVSTGLREPLTRPAVAAQPAALSDSLNVGAAKE